MLKRVAPPVEWCSLRVVRSEGESLAVERGVVSRPSISEGTGAMVTVVDDGGIGVAATADLSVGGIYQAARTAQKWAERSARRGVCDFSRVPRPKRSGSFATLVERPWESMSISEKIDLLRDSCDRLAVDSRIVDRSAGLTRVHTEQTLVTTDDILIEQTFDRIMPELSATAAADGDAQVRSLGGRAICMQGGLEILDVFGFVEASGKLGHDALDLLAAPQCPTETTDLVLLAGQMVLQVHESIGHPLELDRILGDERNYAGTSFVRAEDFGSLRYGSDLLNISFDPTVEGEFASYSFDDDGTPAEKVMLIENGILKRGLGGTLSQHRLGIEGVSCTRASSWNRPPIDRMANLNLEPGDSTLDDLVSSCERGILMDNNVSWSIDDSRNKFQFGCEYAIGIEDGRLTGLLKNPNYRGISSTFWRNLDGVGDRSTFKVLGTPNCGKGEPNQMISVGHAVPACLFRQVEVFGGGD
ncbi:MAG TPA: TldD/PmbA family protein [Planctomycetes bacterium]|nr:TldD/PmbA family protein [Planctomycetota bacterium]HIN81272.1 TldD/PmbA family protein [Planctomycetota bacterium]